MSNGWKASMLVAMLGASTAVHAAPRPSAGADMSSDNTSGAALYVEYCSACHGTEGHGNGPLASGLTVPPAKLRRLAMDAGGIFPADRVRAFIDGRAPLTAHGDREMPIWGQAFSQRHGDARAQQRIDRLLDYLEHWQLP